MFSYTTAKSRYVRLSDNRARLVWRDAGLAKAADAPSDGDYCIALAQITNLKKGKQTAAFARPDAAQAQENLCFSVVAEARTLDLQAVSEAVRDQWAQALHELLLFVHTPAPQTVKGDALVTLARGVAVAFVKVGP